MFLYALTLLMGCQFASQTPSGEVTIPLESPSGTLWVDYIDVGQGDSTLIVLPNHKTILIDCGNTGKGDEVLSVVKKRTKSIDLLIATHADADHMGACDEVMRGIPVVSVLENGQGKDTKAYSDFVTEAQLREYRILLDDEDLAFDPSVGLRLMAAYDDDGMDKDTNENSIVLKLTYGSRSLLFTGDCEFNCEKTLQETEDVNVDVYKAGHHGSSTSSTDTFLSEVTPSAVIVSVGVKNSYGHPSPYALDRLGAYTDAVFRTDQKGTLTLSTDGTELKISDKNGLLWWKN